jgi:uncharacterized lipoprotein YmbA
MTSRSFVLGLVLTTALATTACVSVQTRTTREYTLSWRAEIPSDFQRSAVSEPRGQSIAIGPIVTPTYLQRAGIVRRSSNNRIEASTASTWAEPIESGIARLLVEAVAVETGVNRVARMPWPFPGAPDLRIAVEIIQFEYESASGSIRLIARWTLLDGQRGRARLVRGEILTQEVESDDIEAIVASMSHAVIELGGVIAEDIAQLEQLDRREEAEGETE